MESFPRPLPILLKALMNPKFFIQGVLQYAIDWFYTRQWSVLWFSLPVLLIAGLGIGFVTYGNFQSTTDLANYYLSLVSEEVPDFDITGEGAGLDAEAADPDARTDESPNGQEGEARRSEQNAEPDENRLIQEASVSDYGQMLLRRVLQLQGSNQRAQFLVAIRMARAGRLGQARSMMRALAPEGQQGFPPAHAWLAADRLLRNSGLSMQERNLLLNDLEVASRWIGTGPPLIAMYAKLLEEDGRIGDALRVLADAQGSSFELRLLLADMAKRNGRVKIFEDVLNDSKQEVEQKIRSGGDELSDYITLANLSLLQGEPEQAHKAIEYGMGKTPGDQRLKRLKSEAFRLQYLKNSKLENGQLKAQLGFLDAALRSDPSNPKVGEEIAKLLAAGNEASAELERALQTQLASGKSTALTHILLADRKLRVGELKKAIPHLELALDQAPGNSTALNNLALALAMTDETQLNRAIELSQRAVSSSPENAEYIDTLGEIRELNGDLNGAIECYQQAIRLDDTRLQSHQKLANAYRRLGLGEMAVAHEQKVAALKKSTP